MSDVAVDKKPDLAGRTAVCTQHRISGQWSSALMTDADPGPGAKPSSWDLPYFRHRPDQETDSYYCGCWGWN